MISPSCSQVSIVLIFREVGTSSQANLIQMVYSVTTLTLPLPDAGRAILRRAAVAVKTDKLATKQLRHCYTLEAKSILEDLESCLGLWKVLSPVKTELSVLEHSKACASKVQGTSIEDGWNSVSILKCWIPIWPFWFCRSSLYYVTLNDSDN